MQVNCAVQNVAFFRRHFHEMIWCEFVSAKVALQLVYFFTLFKIHNVYCASIYCVGEQHLARCYPTYVH